MSANPPQLVIEQTYGALVSGIWIQQLLFGFILAQMVDYYRTQYKTDTLANKIIVSLLLALNVLLGGVDFHVLYRCSVLYYGDYAFFDLQEWTMWTEPGWTAIVGFVAQVFFLIRCQRITKSTPITVFLTLLVLFSFGSGLAVSGSFISLKHFSSLGQFKLPITLWLISTAVADIALAGVLSFYLLRSRSSFKRTDTVVTRIVIIAMETSALTAMVALLNLVLFLPMQDTAYHLLPQFSISRVYTLTVLATVLARTSHRTVLMTNDQVSLPTSLFRTNNNLNNVSNTTANNVRVDVTTMVDTNTTGAIPTFHTDTMPGDTKTDFIDLEERKSEHRNSQKASPV